MNRFLRRCKAKKGFTIMELVVVIAIIGIILAIVLPTMFASDKPTKGKAYAKSYFYTAQDFMSQKRINADLLTSPAFTGDLALYTTVDESGNVVESGEVQMSGGSVTGMRNVATVLADTGVTNDDYKSLLTDYEFHMDNYVEPGDYAGTFYCIVDSNYCVQASYWSEGTIAELLTNSSDLSFEDTCIVGGYVTCAFPEEFSDVTGVAGKKMFDYTY